MKIIIKYHIEFGNEVIVCNSLEEAERKIKNMSETDRYLIKSEYDGDELINQFLIG